MPITSKIKKERWTITMAVVNPLGTRWCSSLYNNKWNITEKAFVENKKYRKLLLNVWSVTTQLENMVIKGRTRIQPSIKMLELIGCWQRFPALIMGDFQKIVFAFVRKLFLIWLLCSSRSPEMMKNIIFCSLWVLHQWRHGLVGGFQGFCDGPYTKR